MDGEEKCKIECAKLRLAPVGPALVTSLNTYGNHVWMVPTSFPRGPSGV